MCFAGNAILHHMQWPVYEIYLLISILTSLIWIPKFLNHLSAQTAASKMTIKFNQHLFKTVSTGLAYQSALVSARQLSSYELPHQPAAVCIDFNPYQQYMLPLYMMLLRVLSGRQAANEDRVIFTRERKGDFIFFTTLKKWQSLKMTHIDAEINMHSVNHFFNQLYTSQATGEMSTKLCNDMSKTVSTTVVGERATNNTQAPG